jgi:hypothetical protein
MNCRACETPITLQLIVVMIQLAIENASIVTHTRDSVKEDFCTFLPFNEISWIIFQINRLLFPSALILIHHSVINHFANDAK